MGLVGLQRNLMLFFSKLGESSGLNGTFYWNMGSWHCMCGLLILIQLEYWYFQLPYEVKGTHKLWRKRLLIYKEFYGSKSFLPPQGLVALPPDFATKTTLSMSIGMNQQLLSKVAINQQFLVAILDRKVHFKLQILWKKRKLRK